MRHTENKSYVTQNTAAERNIFMRDAKGSKETQM